MNHSACERLIGFDVRENWLDGSVLWSPARRTLYLVNAAVPKPLSVDPLVWPTVLDFGGLSLATVDETFDEQWLLPLQEHAGPNHPLYSDDALLRRIVAARWFRPDREVVGLGISVVLTNDSIHSTFPYPHGALPEEAQHWSFLGYDIGDAGFISALMNCGYSTEERAEAIQNYASVLNMHHLFDDISSAQDFCQWSQERVAEHAPFLIYGLYITWRITSRPAP